MISAQLQLDISDPTPPADPKREDPVWLSAREVAELEGVSWKQVKVRCRLGRYAETRQVVANGGRQYRIALSSLSSDARMKYHLRKVKDGPEASDRQIDAEIYSRAPEWARRKADKYLAIINNSAGLKGAELQAFVVAWNAEHPDVQTSYARVLDARKAYKTEGVGGLLAQYGNRAGLSIVRDEWFTYFKGEYLKEGAPSLKSSWWYTLGFAKDLDPDLTEEEFPGASAFLHRLEAEVPLASQYLARHGQAAWNRRFASYINRDYSAIRVGSVFVSDHHQLDVAVINPATGKPCFPWITTWRDFKSGKWLAWIIHCEAPNSDHIFMSFYLACLAYGLPDEILIDNGKDYRCRDFAGGRIHQVKSGVDEIACKKQISTLSLLNVIVHFALPYNAQAKPIERDFLRLIEIFSRHLIGYRGGNVTEKPEKLAHEIASGSILPFDKLQTMFDSFVADSFNNMPSTGKNLLGKSPNQLWSEEFTEKKEVSKDALKLFCMRSSQAVTIGRNGVRDSDLGVYYWGEWMSGAKGEKVYLRRNVKDYATAWVFRASNDECIDIARMAQFDAPALARTEVEKQEFKAAISQRRADAKIAKSYVESHCKADPMEQMRLLKIGVAMAGGVAPEAQPKIHRIANTEMDQVIIEQRKRQEAGTGDLSAIMPEEPIGKKPIFLFDSDREEYERKQSAVA